MWRFAPQRTGVQSSCVFCLKNGNCLDIAFLRVESIWLGLEAGEDGWNKVETAIDAMFQTCNKVMIESLRIGKEFVSFQSALAEKYPIITIRVYADLKTCFNRVKNRDSSAHIAVSDANVIEYNRMAAAVSRNWDLEINNNGPAPDVDILDAIQSVGAVILKE